MGNNTYILRKKLRMPHTLGIVINILHLSKYKTSYQFFLNYDFEFGSFRIFNLECLYFCTNKYFLKIHFLRKYRIGKVLLFPWSLDEISKDPERIKHKSIAEV